MDTLKTIVRAAVSGYAKKGLNSVSYMTHTDDDSIFSVVTVPQNQSGSFVSLLVRILPQIVIIERDQNDKPLVDALLQAGIPRNQIILAYTGEPVPEIS
jgi:hypothetical protein